MNYAVKLYREGKMTVNQICELQMCQEHRYIGRY
ncbi:resolvase, plasmid (plasmid) [Staphylococcus aureus]|nr:resolvase, plasmid [Staphylococcus aureus]